MSTSESSDRRPTLLAILRCILGKCEKSRILRQEWLPADADHATVRLLRFNECPHCHATRATITSPEPEETRFSEPTYWMVNQVPTPEGAKP